MKNSRKVLLTACLPLLLISFDGFPAEGSKYFEVKFAEALRLCDEIAFPNTQARPPGFDINAHVKKLEGDRLKVSKAFHSKKGIRFLKKKLGVEKDEANVKCIKTLIDENEAR